MVMAIFKLYYFPSDEDFRILDRKKVYYPNLLIPQFKKDLDNLVEIW